ncbi:MAG: hypothetical protein QXY50_03100 [Candidatus Caldarchaeum sp.]
MGWRITAELRSIIEAHKEMVKEAVAEIKALTRAHKEEKLSIIKEYIEEVKRTRDEIKSQMESLVEQFRASNVSRDDFLSQMHVLRERMKALAKSSEKLGVLLNRVSKDLADEITGKVEELRKANMEFGQTVSEAAKKIGETARSEAQNRTGRAVGRPAQTHTQPGRGNR